jgi:hypothetical protein
MATPEEIAAIKAKIQAKLLAEQGVKDPGSVQEVTPVNAAKKNEALTLEMAVNAGLLAKKGSHFRPHRLLIV